MWSWPTPTGTPGGHHACPHRAQGPRQGQHPPPGPCTHRPGLPVPGAVHPDCTWAPVSSQGSVQSKPQALKTEQRAGRGLSGWAELPEPSPSTPGSGWGGLVLPLFKKAFFFGEIEHLYPPKSLKHQCRFMKQSCALQRKKQKPPLQETRPCPTPVLTHDFYRLFL